MIAKIKVGCEQCMGLGYKRHYHSNYCYSGLTRELDCNLPIKTSCKNCDCLGYIIYTGEVLELNPKS